RPWLWANRATWNPRADEAVATIMQLQARTEHALSGMHTKQDVVVCRTHDRGGVRSSFPAPKSVQGRKGMLPVRNNACCGLDRGPIVNDGVPMATTRSSLLHALMAAALLALSTATVTAQGTWTKGAAMPSERSEIAATEMGGKIYVMGGYRGEV